MFSATALEGFINELAECAQLQRANESPLVGQFAGQLGLAEDQRVPTEFKFRLASIVFAENRAYPADRQLWENFGLLFRARDALVHLKDDIVRVNTTTGAIAAPRSLVQQFQRLGIAANLPEGTAASLTIRLSTPPAARWACNTAASMARAVLDVLPESGFRPKPPERIVELQRRVHASQRRKVGETSAVGFPDKPP